MNIPARHYENNGNEDDFKSMLASQSIDDDMTESPATGLATEYSHSYSMPFTGPPGGWPTNAPEWWTLNSPWATRTSSPLISDIATGSPDPYAYSEHGEPTTTPILIESVPPLASSTGSDYLGGQGPASWGQKAHSNVHGGLFVAAGLVPAALVAIIGVAIFFFLRKRKRQRKQQIAAQARMQEMKARDPQSYAQARYAAAPQPPPASSSQQQYTVPPNRQLLAASPPAPQPVILGPIVPGSNGAYYTGIDTSDVVSVDSGSGLGNPFANNNEIHEEPPPPYRPRSLAPLSRDSSLRAPPPAHSQTNLIAAPEQPSRSPFADPRDDDAVSELSGSSQRRNADGMSVVSNLSYQHDPIVPRRSV